MDVKMLLYLPDISLWKLDNAKIISYLFCNCSSLSVIPNISNWNVDKVKEMVGLFKNCSSLTEICDLNIWNIQKKTRKSNMFENCISLANLPYEFDNPEILAENSQNNISQIVWH